MFGRVVFVATLGVAAALLGSFSLLERLPAPGLSLPRPLRPPSRRFPTMRRPNSTPFARCSRTARSRFGLMLAANTRPTRW